MVIKILLISVALFCFLGMILRFVSIARLSRIFKPDTDTLAWQIIRTDYLGAIFNALTQYRLIKAGKIRWMVHGLMVTGFIYLVVVHALDYWTGVWFDWYQPGINPFRFLRNLAGVMVMVACIGFLIRRTLGSRINMERRRRGIQFRVRGTLSILLILGIVISGFLAEGFQIMSQTRFDQMVEEYSGLSGEPELDHLKAYWAQEYYVYFEPIRRSGTQGDQTPERADLTLGEELNLEYCLECHSLPDTAFVSLPVARVFTLWGSWIDAFGLDRIFYWLHFALVMVLTAFFPFSRMFHLISIPLATARRRMTPERMRTQMGYLDLVGMSACTHCGFCSQVCSVFPDYQITENPQVLPHVKIETMKRLAGKGVWDLTTLTRLRTGNDDCTRCGLCADICPSGIDLVRLWTAADHLMDRLGCPKNYTAAMDAGFTEWMGTNPRGPAQTGTGEEGNLISDRDHGSESDNQGILPGLMKTSDAFEHCVQCTLCTNTCPVVAHDLNFNDLGPHQIMNMLRLGEQQMASGSKMVWHCLTCYACQEVCPQSIRVTDILLELRCRGQNRAAELTLAQLKGERP